eukprot:Clim_evm48s109 gene=Clim_evmTU48s109
MGKKKNRKQRDDSDDDWEAEAMALEAEVKQPAGFTGLEIEGDDDDSEEDMPAPQPKKTAGFAGLEVEGDDDDDDEDEDEESAEIIKPSKKQKNKPEKTAEPEPLDLPEEIEAPKLLTKAEKAKLKKQKEKEKKKAAQAKKKQQQQEEDDEFDQLEPAVAENDQIPVEAQGKKGKKKTEEDDFDAILEQYGEQQPAEEELTPETPATPRDGGDEGDEEEEDAGGKKKKKKKKKKGAAAAVAEAAPTKKGPSALAQRILEQKRIAEEQEERLRQLREEEERLRQEEEARLAEEERLEEERREQQRIKDKERRERQKQARQEREREEKRLKALEMMQSGGIEIAALKDEDGAEPEKRKKPVYGKKKGKGKGAGQRDPSAVVKETPSPTQTPVEEKQEEKKKEEEVPAAWDASSDDEADNWEDLANDGKAKETDTKKVNGGAAAAEAEVPAGITEEERKRREAKGREAVIKRQQEEDAKTAEAMRSPICVVLGHVDAGKTSLLDKIRKTKVQAGEAGGITQQIGASYFPADALNRYTSKLQESGRLEIKVPGLLIIDTPGHESFANLRARGQSMCDIAVLVVDILSGLEPQTIESIHLLRKGKTPFVVALNKVDRLYEWKSTKDGPIVQSIKNQPRNVLLEYEDRVTFVKTQLAEQGLNSELYYKNKDFKKVVSLVPTSAHTGEGVPDLLMLLVQLTQRLMADRLGYNTNVMCTVLEVKVVQGLGTTIDVILANGVLREGDTIVLCGLDGPIVTTIRSLLMPAPLKELRVKNQYVNHKEVKAAQGVKIVAKELENTVAGLQLHVARDEDEIEFYKGEVQRDLEKSLDAFRTDDIGVSVQASTLGSLEAMMEFLRGCEIPTLPKKGIPVARVNIGPVHRKDVVRTSTMLKHDAKFACILAFDVKLDKDAEDMAKKEGVTIYQSDVIYHLFDRFVEHIDKWFQAKKEEYRTKAIFPCRIKIISEDHVFAKRDPIIVGVRVVAGELRRGTPLIVPAKDKVDIGIVESMEKEHKEVVSAKVGDEVAVRIFPGPGSAPKLVGRHFEWNDDIVSRLSRDSIDLLKLYFRDELKKPDWKLVIELKKMLDIS